jgi:hypothetical protein
MSENERWFRRIAIGLAAAALLTAGLAVLVVVMRDTDRARAAPVSRQVAVNDLRRLAPSTVEQRDDGVRVTDAALCKSLGLARDDTIVAISGRQVRVDELRAVLRKLGTLRPRSLFVDLVRDRAPVLERWELDDELTAGLPADDDDPAPGGASLDPLIATIRRISGTSYLVPRSTIEAWIADPAVFASGGQIVATTSLGRLVGCELRTVRTDSVYAALGLQSGDTIRAINGNPLESVDRVLELVARSTTLITVDVRRGDQPIIFDYLVR